MWLGGGQVIFHAASPEDYGVSGPLHALVACMGR